jgi:hypothetical protein
LQGLDFYLNLTPQTQFHKLVEGTGHLPVPEDWSLLLTDIKGSTKAIEAGRFQDVNLMGAAAITVVMQHFGTSQIPFVFGGDGATFVLPTSALQELLPKLANLTQVSHSNFGLELRVGHVPVAQMTAAGKTLFMAKYQLSSSVFQASLSGTGVSYAEDIIKSEVRPTQEQLPQHDSTGVNLDSLSCRFEPFRSKHGIIVSLIVDFISKENSHQIASEIVQKMENFAGRELFECSPVQNPSRSQRWLPSGVFREANLASGPIQKLTRLFFAILKSIVAKAGNRFKLSLGSFDGKTYLSELASQSDFKKFDSCLRVVLDCSHDEFKSINSMLAKLQTNSILRYGYHISDSAIMTCVVHDLASQQHIHFIDGSKGGYAKAAAMMKASSVDPHSTQLSAS